MKTLARVRVRPFQASDLRRILEIEKQSFGADAWPAEWFREYAASCPKLFLTAHSGPSIVGYSITCVARERAELASIAVARRARGRGVARRLLTASLRSARRDGAAAIRLMVRIDNEGAIGLYRKFGFVRLRTITRYYQDGASGWLMELPL